MKQILNLVQDHKFHINEKKDRFSYFSSSRKIINEIVKNRRSILTDVVYYVNNGERLTFLNEKFQDQIVNFFIANLALVTVGKASGNAQLTQDFAELKKQDLIQKFFFSDEKRNHEYLDFIVALQTLQGRDNLTLADVQEFGAEFIETYTREITREVNGVEEVYKEERSSYTNRFVEEFHECSVQILDLLEDLNPVKCVTLREIRTALHNLVVNLNDYTDFIINSQEPLQLCNLVESKFATFQNPELMAIWHALRSKYVNSDQDLDDLDYLLKQYFGSLGYRHSRFTSSFECFEHELEVAIEQAAAQGHKQPEVVAVSQFINRLEHVSYYFIRNKNSNEVRNLLLDKDRTILSDKQLAWINLYLNDCKNDVVNLYYSYLDGNLNLADYLACLHAYWVQNVTNELFSAYHNVERSLHRYNVDYFEVKSRAQENNVEFAREFVQACRDNTLVISEVPSKDPQELANFLVYQSSREVKRLYKINHLLELLLEQTHQLNQNDFYSQVRLIEEDQLSLESLSYRNELGNYVLIRDRSGLFDCETQEERLAYIYANALENQQLPPAGTAITPEVLKQRSVALLTQILEVVGFDKTEHLQLS